MKKIILLSLLLGLSSASYAQNNQNVYVVSKKENSVANQYVVKDNINTAPVSKNVYNIEKLNTSSTQQFKSVNDSNVNKFDITNSIKEQKTQIKKYKVEEHTLPVKDNVSNNPIRPTVENNPSGMNKPYPGMRNAKVGTVDEPDLLPQWK